jgi:hypothetical protein
MTPLTAFKITYAVNLHFTSADYSMLKYGINTKSAVTKYDRLTQGQRYKYDWLASKVSDQQDMMYLAIGCQFDSVSVPYGSKDEILESYRVFKARREGLSYAIKHDIEKHKTTSESVGLEKLIFSYLIGSYSPEYILLLDEQQHLLDKMYNAPNLSWAKDKILKLIKYKHFFNTQRYLPLLNHEATTN